MVKTPLHTAPPSSDTAAPKPSPWTPAAHLDAFVIHTREQQLMLSAMADQKASILIAGSGLIIPLTVQHLTVPSLRWAALTIIVFSALTLFLATYSVMPRVFRRHRGTPRAEHPGTNLLFFGTFTRLSYTEFTRVMGEVVSDGERLYEVQLREIYLHGKHLADHKYWYLGLAYLALLVGVVLGGMAWALGQLVAR